MKVESSIPFNQFNPKNLHVVCFHMMIPCMNRTTSSTWDLKNLQQPNSPPPLGLEEFSTEATLEFSLTLGISVSALASFK